MITEDKVTELFFMADEFCKFFDWMMARYTLKNTGKRPYHRESTLSKAEIMLIIILFHDSGYRCFKHFYLDNVCKHLRHLFPKVVSYNRFVELEKEVAIPIALFIKKVLLGKCTGISFVDSTPIRVCRNQRIHIHRTFKGIAQRGKCSMGWFFGFKLHLICNEKGELLNFMITPGDIDDREPLKYNAFVEFLYGKLVGDKGYIGKELFQRLFVNGIQLITKLKSNMKGALMSVSDKLLLRKRAIIETVNDELKNIAQIEHSRHRCFDNFIVNILGAIAAYCMFPKKPCINVQRTLDTQFTKAIRQALGGAYFSFHNSQRLQGKMVLGEDSYGHSGDKYFWPLSYSSARPHRNEWINWRKLASVANSRVTMAAASSF